jgi:hypothetical protein
MNMMATFSNAQSITYQPRLRSSYVFAAPYMRVYWILMDSTGAAPLPGEMPSSGWCVSAAASFGTKAGPPADAEFICRSKTLSRSLMRRIDALRAPITCTWHPHHNEMSIKRSTCEGKESHLEGKLCQ